MVKKIVLNVLIGILLVVNVANMILSGITILNTTAAVVCLICLALNFVDRIRDND